MPPHRKRTVFLYGIVLPPVLVWVTFGLYLLGHTLHQDGSIVVEPDKLAMNAMIFAYGTLSFGLMLGLPMWFWLSYCEKHKLKNIGTYILTGFVAGAFVSLIFSFGLVFIAPVILLIAATLGAAIGILYWWICGRSAGGPPPLPSVEPKASA